MVKKIILLSILFIFQSRVLSQADLSGSGQSVSGFVKDESNDETLIAVNIFLKGTNLGAITNKGGYYLIDDIPAGKFTIVFSYIGYEQKEITIQIEKNKPITLNVDLIPKVLETQEVIVTSEREAKEREVKTSSIRINARTLKRAPQMAEADLMRTLQMLPGVLTLSEFSSGLYVRGGTPDQNLILLDGTEVYNINHLFGIFSTFDVDAVKHVELLKGGFPVEYGSRLSSVLDIRNMDGNQKEFEGKTAVGLVSAKTSLQGPVGKGAWFFSGRRTYIDYVINAAESNTSGSLKEDLELIPDYYFYDGHFKLYQDLSQQDKLALTIYRGQDVLDFYYEPFSFTFQWGNRAITGKWTHIFNKRFYTDIYITLSKYNVFVNRDDVLFSGRVENNVDDVTLKVNTEYFLSNSHIVKFGLNYKNLDSKYLQRLNKIEYIFRSGSDHFSFYLQDNWRVTPLFRIKYGIRLNHYRPDKFKNTHDDAEYQGENRWDVEPRISFRYLLSENTSLKGSWGRYNQYISIVPFGTADFSFLDVWFPGDNSYTQSSAYHYILGMETTLPMDIYFDTELYYKDMNNLLEFNPAVNTVLKGKDLFHQGSGYAYGIDFYFEKKIGKLSGWLSYFWSWTKRKFPEINKGKEYFPKYDRRNSFYAVGLYQLSSRWFLNFAWTYGTGQAFTQPAGQYKLPWIGDDKLYVLGEDKNLSRLPPYHRMDIGVRYQRKIKNSFLNEWAFYLQIFNVYNRRNIWFRNTDLTTDSVPEEFQIRMLPIVPTFGFELYF